MNMPLAACLPDFGPSGAPAAADERLGADAAFRPLDGMPTAASGAAARAAAGRGQPAASGATPGKLKPAGSTLKSVVRHIKLVDGPAAIAPLVEPAPSVDIDALLKEHGEKIRKEEEGKAKAALAAALTGERKAHEEQRRQERALWVAAESARLAERIEATLAEIEDELSRSLTRIFTPFLKAAVRDRAIGELQDMVLDLLGEASRGRIEISGPDDLIGKIREAIAGSAPERIDQLTFAVSDAADVRVVAGETVCATQIDSWNRRIEGVLGTP